MKQTKYTSGDWNAICDVCGFKFKASDLKDRWDGLKVCHKDWEPRNILDFIKAPKGDKGVAWSRPEATDTFVTVNYISETVGTQETTIPRGNNDGSL